MTKITDISINFSWPSCDILEAVKLKTAYYSLSSKDNAPLIIMTNDEKPFFFTALHKASKKLRLAMVGSRMVLSYDIGTDKNTDTILFSLKPSANDSIDPIRLEIIDSLGETLLINEVIAEWAINISESMLYEKHNTEAISTLNSLNEQLALLRYSGNMKSFTITEQIPS